MKGSLNEAISMFRDMAPQWELSRHVTKCLCSKQICEDAFLALVHVRAIKIQECDGALFVVSQAGKRELSSMLCGIYAAGTMKSSQSLTPNHLKPSDTEPNNRTQSQFLGKGRREQHKYSERKVLFSVLHWTHPHLHFLKASQSETVISRYTWIYLFYFF